MIENNLDDYLNIVEELKICIQMAYYSLWNQKKKTDLNHATPKEHNNKK